MTPGNHFSARTLKGHRQAGKLKEGQDLIFHRLKGDAEMNIHMMEGLVGASASMKLSGTSMSVYRQASAEGDTEKMKRALGYAGECTEKALAYQGELDKGMKAEAKAAREKAKEERESAIENRREERKAAEEARAERPREKEDTVQISQEARAEPQQLSATPPAGFEPVIYAASGEAAAPAEEDSTVAFFA